jgi:HTH-type transcriptional regulator, sugar sensing transcriptional regulator
MDPSALKEAGLTRGEAQVYIALLRLGPTTTGPLAAEARISSSKVYKVLDRLEKKGLAGRATHGKIQRFSAMEPRRLLDSIEEKERELAASKGTIGALIPALEAERTRAKGKTHAAAYEGFKAISNFYNGILDDLRAGDTYHVIGAGYGAQAPGVKAFFQNYHARRAGKGIRVKMLANGDMRESLVPATRLRSSIRFLPQYLVTNMVIVFYRRKAFFFFLTEEPRGFLIESDEIAESLKRYFGTLWSIAKR